MQVTSFACGVWLGVCTTVTLLMILDLISSNDDDGDY